MDTQISNAQAASAQVSGADKGKFIHRHLSQLKILARLVEHELDSSKGPEVAMDRELVESLLDTLEIFVEDVEREGGTGRLAPAVKNDKPAVTRLN